MRKLSFKQYKQELADLFKIINDSFIRNNITWFAHSGTLLGAKRYGDFIPWDDDIDMGMTSNEFYSKKDIIIKILGDNDLRLADKTDYIGLNNSRIISNEKIIVTYEGNEYITSLFIDIMIAIPCRKINKYKRYFWFISCRLLQIFSTFWTPLPRFKTTKKGPKRICLLTQLLVFISRIIIFPVLILHYIEKFTIKKSVNSSGKYYYFHYGWSYQDIYYTDYDLNNFESWEINKNKINVNRNWEYELQTRYGFDYIKEPEIISRHPHHITLTPNINGAEYKVFPHIIR